MSTIRQLDDVERKWWVRGRYGVGVCVSVALVDGPLTREVALAAGRRLQERHSLLRARITGTDDPVFEDVSITEPPIRICELESSGGWARLADEELHRALDAERGPLWRAVIGLAPVAHETHAIVFTFHHSIVDGRSQIRIVEQFVALCSALVADPGARVTVVEPPPPLASLVDLITAPAPPRTRKRVLPIEAKTSPAERRTRFQTRTLDAETFAKLQQRLKVELTTMHALLCVAVLRTVHELAGAFQDFQILSPVDLRPFCSRKISPEHIGCYASALALLSSSAEGEIWEQTRSYHRELLTAIGGMRWRMPSMRSPEEMAAEARLIERIANDDEAQGRAGDVIISSGGDIGVQSGAIRITAYFDPSAQHFFGHHFALLPHAIGPTYSLTLIYATPTTSEAFATRFFDAVVGSVIGACA
jgi:hypothetical protein